jgi:hypothetical protein
VRGGWIGCRNQSLWYGKWLVWWFNRWRNHRRFNWRFYGRLIWRFNRRFDAAHDAWRWHLDGVQWCSESTIHVDFG